MNCLVRSQQAKDFFLHGRESILKEACALRAGRCLNREQLGADFRRQFLDDVFPGSNELGALLDHLVRGKADVNGYVPGNAINFAAKLHPQPRGDERTGILRALYHDNAEGYSRHHAVAHWEILWCRMRPQRKFADQRATLFNFREQFLVLLGVDDVYPRAKYADRRAVSSPASALVRQAVYPTRHAADDRQAALGKIG